MAPNLPVISVEESPFIPFPKSDISDNPCMNYTEMTDTITNLTCEGGIDCTKIDKQPGANIYSPIILGLTGITGQIWALILLYRRKRTRNGGRSSRTVFYIMLSTLIWTDLIGKLLTTPPAIIAYINKTWIGGKSLCNFHGYTMMSVGLVTHFLVSVMAIERYLGIQHGYYYGKTVTPSKARLLLMGIWLFTVIFCAFPLFGFGQYSLQYPGTWGFVNIHVCSESKWYHQLYTNLYGIFNVLNLIVIVFCNMIVVVKLLQNINGHPCSSKGSLIKTRLQRDNPSEFCQRHCSSKQRELEIQMVIVLVVITIVFLVSWSPLDFLLFVNQFKLHKTRDDHKIDLWFIRMVSFNQIIDPWVYILCRKVIFRRKIWRQLQTPLFGRNWVNSQRNSSIQLWIPKKLSRTFFSPGMKDISPNNDNKITEQEISLIQLNHMKKSPEKEIYDLTHPKFMIKETKEFVINKEIEDVCKDSGTSSYKNGSIISSEDFHSNVEKVPENSVFYNDLYRININEQKSGTKYPDRTARPKSETTERDKQHKRHHTTIRHKDHCKGTSDHVSNRRHSWCFGEMDNIQYLNRSTQTSRQNSPAITVQINHNL